MHVLVTGATGFIGSAVARQLADRGWKVRILARSGSPRDNIAGLDAEVLPGDLLDKDSLVRAARGCKAVFHVAADYRLWVPDPKRMYAVNVEGTRMLMNAALEAGVERVVYTSSVATLGIRKDGVPSDEATPSSLADMVGHYKRSKFLAEQVVSSLVAEQGLPAVIVCPSTPVGPRDVKPTPTGRLIRDALAGRMPAYVDTGLNVVHVDDVASGHLAAMEQGRVGERYILGGEDMSLREILGEIARLNGTRPPRVRLPHGAVYPVAVASECLARLMRGFQPQVTRESLRMSRKLMYFSSSKARTHLGYAPRPASEALAAAVEWFRQRLNGSHRGR